MPAGPDRHCRAAVLLMPVRCLALRCGVRTSLCAGGPVRRRRRLVLCAIPRVPVTRAAARERRVGSTGLRRCATRTSGPWQLERCRGRRGPVRWHQAGRSTGAAGSTAFRSDRRSRRAAPRCGPQLQNQGYTPTIPAVDDHRSGVMTAGSPTRGQGRGPAGRVARQGSGMRWPRR